MKYAPVAPPAAVPYLPQTGYHLVLSSLLLKNLTMRRQYQSRIARGEFVIIDNPVHEREATPDLEKLLALAACMKPGAITIDDVIGDPVQTIENYVRIAPLFRQFTEPMAVVQGQNWDQYVGCIKDLADCGAKYIGIPLIRRFAQIDRAAFVEYLVKIGFFVQYPDIRLHLLGSDSTFQDVTTLRDNRYVMGFDSAKPVYLALKGYSLLDVPGNAWGRPDKYWDTMLNTVDDYKDLMRSNVSIMEDLVGGNYDVDLDVDMGLVVG